MRPIESGVGFTLCILRLATILAILAPASYLCAQEAEPEQGGEAKEPVISPEQQRAMQLYASIQWQDGPSNVDVGTVAKIEIPEGYRFTGTDGAKKWAELNGNIAGDDQLGVLMPTADDANWFVVFIYEDIGHVKDDERDELDADALLKTLQEGTIANNEVRRERGMEELEITGWAQPPAYDTKSNNLIWATKLIVKGQPRNESANYQTRLLGRTGVMKVILVCDEAQLKATVPALDNLLAHYEFKEGQKYAEWREGDKLAAVGLTGLIAGGAAVVAAKTGLFAKLFATIAKMGKVIVVAIIAVVAGVSRLFKRSSTPQNVE